MIGWWAPWVITMDGPPLRDALILIDEETGTISSITPNVRGADVNRASEGASTTKWHESVIAPGFVNLHSHVEYGGWDLALAEMYSGNQTAFESFADWISDHILRKRRLSDADLALCATYGAHQLLSSGITFTVDASYTGSAALAALGKAGLRGIVCGEVFGSDSRNAFEILRRLTDQSKAWPLVDAGLSPHSPYTAGTALFEMADASGAVWTTHVLESVDETLHYQGAARLADGFAKGGIDLPPWTGDSTSPVEELAHTFSTRSILVHLVQSDENAISRIKESGAIVVHCPRSNNNLRCGRFPFESFANAGVLVCLGTDSPASAGPLDMFEEMRSALETHQSLLDAQAVLEMATSIPAAAMGRSELGRLVAGGAADMFVLNASDQIADQPIGESPINPVELLVNHGNRSRIQSTMVKGKLVYRQTAIADVGSEMTRINVEIGNLADRLAEPVARVATN